jgi:hypothetical protein
MGHPARSTDSPSQVAVSAAMRARDVSRPDADDIAGAAASVEISYRPNGQAASRQPRSSRRGGNSPDAS